jgi:hypothetical protein
MLDVEVKRMTDAAYDRAKDLQRKHSKEHHLLAETLLEYETLTGEEVRELIKRGVKPKRPVINKDSEAIRLLLDRVVLVAQAVLQSSSSHYMAEDRDRKKDWLYSVVLLDYIIRRNVDSRVAVCSIIVT